MDPRPVSSGSLLTEGTMRDSETSVSSSPLLRRGTDRRAPPPRTAHSRRPPVPGTRTPQEGSSHPLVQTGERGSGGTLCCGTTVERDVFLWVGSELALASSGQRPRSPSTPYPPSADARAGTHLLGLRANVFHLDAAQPGGGRGLGASF